MQNERITIKKGLIQIATKQLGNEYLNKIENVRKNEEYKKLITLGWENLKADTYEMFSKMVDTTFTQYEEEVFGRVVIEYAVFLVQTESYNPPEEEIKVVMKVALINENIMEKTKVAVEDINHEYIKQHLLSEVIK